MKFSWTYLSDMDPKFLIFFILGKYWLALFRGERNPHSKNSFKRYQKYCKTYHFAVWGLTRLVIRCATENQKWHRKKWNPEGCNFYHHFASVICLEINKNKILSKIKETSAGKKHGRHVKKYTYEKMLTAHKSSWLLMSAVSIELKFFAHDPNTTQEWQQNFIQRQDRSNMAKDIRILHEAPAFLDSL